jgi:hypothetical protein
MKSRNINDSLNGKKSEHKDYFENKQHLMKLFNFVFQQFYIYFVMIFMFYSICNFDKIFFLVYKQHTGTLLFLYSDIAAKLKEQALFFFFPSINFLLGTYFDFKQGSAFSFLYLFINEIQFFFISIVFLFAYSKKRNGNFFVIFILIY